MPFLATDGFLRVAADVTFPTLDAPDGTLVVFAADSGGPADIRDAGTITVPLGVAGVEAVLDFGSLTTLLVAAGDGYVESPNVRVFFESAGGQRNTGVATNGRPVDRTTDDLGASSDGGGRAVDHEAPGRPVDVDDPSRPTFP